MPLCTTADIGFTDARHGNRRLDPRLDADGLQRILHRERVHDRREHTHVIGSRALEALGCRRDPAKDIAAADDDTDFEAHVLGVGDFARDTRSDFGINAEASRPHQHFARQFQEDSFIRGSAHGRAGLP